MEQTRVHPHQALAVYAEPLAAGRRVVVLADPELGLVERLEELGAETVVLLAPGEDFDALRTARFDLALVADLARFDDPAAVVGRVRRMVGESGAAVISAANRAPSDAGDSPSLDYYALFDLVAHEFADVRMVARLGFHGVALAQVGEEDDSPAVSVDTQLADADRSPEAFIAVASQRGTKLDPYAIVELPAPEPVFNDAPDDSQEIEALQGDLDEARTQTKALVERVAWHEVRAGRMAELEHQLAECGRQLADLSAEVDVARAAAEAGRVEVNAARAAAEAGRVEVNAARAAVEAGRVEVNAARAAAEAGRAEATGRAAAGRIAAEQLEMLAARAERAEKALARAEPDLARAAEAHAAELQRFEETLRERAQIVRTLEAEATRREKLARELIAILEERGLTPLPATEEVPPPEQPRVAARVEHDSAALAAAIDDNARLQHKLDAMALELARRQGDAQASAWTIGELETKLALARAQPQGRPVGKGSQPSSELLDELDALRHALTQEHEARVRAESGEELTRARAEIQRQAVLLAQLGQKTSSTEELR